MRELLPSMQRQYNNHGWRSLQVLVISGEVLPISLWDMLHKLLPDTSILNLYGSTEVSGDCTYFNCKNLPAIMKTNVLTSVPIGVPISNCNVVLLGEPNELDEGEIYVSGLCISNGYFLDPTSTSFDYIKLSQDSGLCKNGPELYFRTGDFAKRLHTGELVFLGRKDRTMKINGQRVSFEEIENALRAHHDVLDVAVVSQKGQGEPAYLRAYMVLNSEDEIYENLSSSMKRWLVKKLPPAMLPHCYSVIKSLPTSTTGKIDYALLSRPDFDLKPVQYKSRISQCSRGCLQALQEVFREALMVKEVAAEDDFFVMGGNSITAAQVAYKLGINMELLYVFSSPSKLLNALLDNDHSHKHERAIESLCADDSLVARKYLKVDSAFYHNLDTTTSKDINPWTSGFSLSVTCSFCRCNKVRIVGEHELTDVRDACWSVNTPRNRKGYMCELWKVNLRSCVDGSPLVVLKDGGVYLFIGSHSHTFLSVDGRSGFTLWEVRLDGRIECSAAIINDFSQVVVGCYKGKIYFLDFMTGNISWTFQTGGEVKSQPVIDECRNLIWCGSYDHNLYALDYINHNCVYSIACGGSIYGSPSIDKVRNILYVASTRGLVTALSIEALPFSSKWVYELGAPVFGSLSVNYINGNVICCLVDGHVIVLSLSGSIVWKAITDGPIFAGSCISYALPSQVIICSRNGSVYSFELEGGELMWEYNIGSPITSSAYVDENMQLISDPSHPSDRLVCICSSSGRIYLLQINVNALIEKHETAMDPFGSIVQEFAKMDLPGDIFSSPVMIGGRIFVGCRDDYVHCIGVGINISAEK
ncbi:hypothetical protein GIB67_042578 [Kingdonia uniflora]|uniref:Acyl-activating enzyme 19 n=1 Tax=Kingdonia uniflora TaxID=39325 RepID=A0A7J7M159_9MAGN|nr:hypothetical protein GIB67_042578 [Kingdonia uniflora]